MDARLSAEVLRKLVMLVGDRKRKGHALNARRDTFITALSDLFEKERMGNLS